MPKPQRLNRNIQIDEADFGRIEFRRRMIAITLWLIPVVLFCAYITTSWGYQLFSVAFQSSQTVQDARLESSRTNMRVILLALQDYSKRRGVLPAPVIVDKNLRPVHSWRTALLPYMFHDSLYDLIDPKHTTWKKLDHEWLKDDDLSSYVSKRSTMASEACTCYAYVVGKGTIFEDHPHFELGSRDGPSYPVNRTGLIIELPETDIRWMEPRDVTVDEAILIIQNSNLRGGTLVGFSDQTVDAILPSTPEDQIRKMFLPTE